MNINDIRTFLEDWGMWTILIMLVAKFISGVLVAIEKNEFKWFYLGNIFKSDLLKVAVFALVTGLSRFSGVDQFESDYVQGGMGAILLTDLIAGVVKNIAHLVPGFADTVSTSFREPARLRLGNPKNLPN